MKCSGETSKERERLPRPKEELLEESIELEPIKIRKRLAIRRKEEGERRESY